MMMMITVCPLTAKLILKAGNVQVRIELQPTTFQCILYLKILAAPRGQAFSRVPKFILRLVLTCQWLKFFEIDNYPKPLLLWELPSLHCSIIIIISNGNRTEWGTIQGVIGRVI